MLAENPTLLKMRRVPFTALALVAAASTCGWIWHDEARHWLADCGWSSISTSSAKPDPERYEVLKREAETWRIAHLDHYRHCHTDKEREAVLAETRTYLEGLLPQMMHCWLGTPWDFNGTATKPGEGKIACGYFVATVLRDAGFRVDRIRLAQESSQNIMGTFLPRQDLKVEVDTPYHTYASRLRESEHGIRIIGLDHHVSFAVCTGSDFRFVHSSGLQPWQVVDQDEAGAQSLKNSSYRVQGLLTGNRDVLLKWLKGEAFPVKQTPVKAAGAEAAKKAVS